MTDVAHIPVNKNVRIKTKGKKRVIKYNVGRKNHTLMSILLFLNVDDNNNNNHFLIYIPSNENLNSKPRHRFYKRDGKNG